MLIEARVFNLSQMGELVNKLDRVYMDAHRKCLHFLVCKLHFSAPPAIDFLFDLSKNVGVYKNICALVNLIGHTLFKQCMV